MSDAPPIQQRSDPEVQAYKDGYSAATQRATYELARTLNAIETVDDVGPELRRWVAGIAALHIAVTGRELS